MKQSLSRGLITSLLLALAGISQVGAQTMLQSPEQKITLLELYTSEGCSSCPPADRWFSELLDDRRLWQQIVPVVFHVDYWDYLGWQDRFAKPEYGDRQSTYAAYGGVSTVYTPGLLVDGKEWRSWFSNRHLQLDTPPKVGVLSVQVDQQELLVEFHPSKASSAALVLNLALLGFGLASEVDAGENEGRRLQHDFVVLAYQKLRLPAEGDVYRLQTQLPTSRFHSDRKALAAWVHAADDPGPIQAVGGWL